MKKIAPAVELYCADCGTELLVPHLTKKKPRKVICSKCYKEIKGVKNDTN